MNDQDFRNYFLIAVFIGVVGGLFLVAYSDGIEFELYKKIRCKYKLHKFSIRIGGYRVRKYYCHFCKEERSHPKLKSIDGGKRWVNNRYKF